MTYTSRSMQHAAETFPSVWEKIGTGERSAQSGDFTEAVRILMEAHSELKSMLKTNENGAAWDYTDSHLNAAIIAWM